MLSSSEKPTGALWLLPIFMGIIGGIIMYVLVRDHPSHMARNGLIVGFVMMVIWLPILSAVLLLSGGFAEYGLSYYSSDPADYDEMKCFEIKQIRDDIARDIRMANMSGDTEMADAHTNAMDVVSGVYDTKC